MPVTKEQFEEKVGREPTETELSQCNCEIIGIPGHSFCGWCDEHDKPRFECNCAAGDVHYIHTRCCNAHWELAVHEKKLGLYCEKCYKPAGPDLMVISIKPPEVTTAPETTSPKVDVDKELDEKKVAISSETEFVKSEDGECPHCGGKGCDACAADGSK